MMTKKYEEATAADLRVGDLILTRYYNVKKEYVEEDWTVTSISTRKYGRGTRYTVTFEINGKFLTTSYNGKQKFGRRVQN